MSHQPVLQPHVVCLGNPVAGNPTQFVMSRATRECGLDWRFFTSQVREDEFEIAVKGVQALGLHGMVLLDPFQAKVIPLLDTVTESARHLNRVTVARSDGNSWLGDNLLPAALWHSIASRIPLVDADSPGEVAADPVVAKSPERTAEKVSEKGLEKGAENEQDSPAKPVDAPKNSILYFGPPELGNALVAAWPSQAWECIQWPVAQSPGEEIAEDAFQRVRSKQYSALVVNGELSGASLRGIQNLNWAASPLLLMQVSLSHRGNQKVADLFAARGFASVEQVEWLAYEAAANFTFWTGIVPPIDLIRESLEEYLQW